MDFLRPDAGEVKIFGKDSRQDSTELKEEIGFLPGEVRLYEDWTGREHIKLLEKIRGVKRMENGLVEKLGFDPSKRVKSLSTGNRQKLGIILAFMHQPNLLILDEPTTGLDPLLQSTIHEILRAKAGEGKTIFMSSHNLAEVERVCDRVCIIKEGKIAAIESVSNLKRKRVYTVYAYFEKEVPGEKELEEINLEVKEKLTDGLILLARGDIDPILDLLERYDLKDLEITHANLEEIFLEYYR
jgi:ABC-2 type transport system ATP-binding protein